MINSTIRLFFFLFLQSSSLLQLTNSNSNEWEYIPPEFTCSPTISSCHTATHSCLANPNHPQSTTDTECKPCQSEQKYWPCDMDGVCYCWDKSRPQIPPAPGTRHYNGGEGLNIVCVCRIVVNRSPAVELRELWIF